MFEILLKIIAGAILKKALAGTGLEGLGKLISVFTFFDTLTSITDSSDLGVSGVLVGYDLLSDPARDYLVSQIGEDKYAIERRSSGLYAVQSRIHRSPVYLGDPRQYPAFVTPVRRIPVRRISTRRIGG